MSGEFRLPKSINELRKMLSELPRTPLGHHYRFVAVTGFVLNEALKELAKRHSREELRKMTKEQLKRELGEILEKVVNEVEKECKLT